MAILGSILKRTFELREKMPKLRKVNGYRQQTRVLKKLMTKAQFTAFGNHYNFSKLLHESDLIDVFQHAVATHDYNSMFKKWWHRAVEGESHGCWPRTVKYFALQLRASGALMAFFQALRCSQMWKSTLE